MSWGVRRSAAALGPLLLAVACSSGSATGAPTPHVTTITHTSSTEVTLPITTATASSRATASPTPAPGSKDFGYFRSVVSHSPARLAFDRAEFLEGDAANTAAAAHGDETPVPNDYYIVNDNPKLRVLTIAGSCAVYGSLQLTSFVDPDGYSVALKREKLSDLIRFIGTDNGRRTPWHLTYGAGGVVTRIDEQYIP